MLLGASCLGLSLSQLYRVCWLMQVQYSAARVHIGKVFAHAGSNANAAYMGQWIFVFEDDAYLPYPATDVRVLISSLLERAGQYYDLIWFGATSPVLEPGEHVYHRRAGIYFRIRDVKSTYGSFAYGIRRTSLQIVARHWAVDGVVLTSDGALRKSLQVLRGGCCDPALAAHRPPRGTGGSRILRA